VRSVDLLWTAVRINIGCHRGMHPNDLQLGLFQAAQQFNHGPLWGLHTVLKEVILPTVLDE
jgi:hypothetical protein